MFLFAIVHFTQTPLGARRSGSFYVISPRPGLPEISLRGFDLHSFPPVLDLCGRVSPCSYAYNPQRLHLSPCLDPDFFFSGAVVILIFFFPWTVGLIFFYFRSTPPSFLGASCEFWGFGPFCVCLICHLSLHLSPSVLASPFALVTELFDTVIS